MLENLRRSSAANNRTTIIIAHRLATVKYADRIIVMKDGVIEEDGQHDALIKAEGLYAELTKSQQFEKRQASAASSIRSGDNSDNSLLKEDQQGAPGISVLVHVSHVSGYR